MAVQTVATVYMQAVHAAPLSTNAATAGFLTVLSDKIAQRLDKDPSRKGVRRSAWALMWGVLCSLLLTPWYEALDRAFPLARASWSQLAGKLAVNQAVVAPGLNALFFCYVIYTQVSPALRMTSVKRKQLVAKLHGELPATILRSAAYWTVMQAINFRMLPPELTVLWTMCASVVWSSYLAFVAHRRL